MGKNIMGNLKMKKWIKAWPSLQSKKVYEVKIVIHNITRLELVKNEDDDDDHHGLSRLTVEIKWKGSRENGFKSMRRKKVKNNYTSEKKLSENGAVLWDEEFINICGFKDDNNNNNNKGDGIFRPWNVSFLVFFGSEKQSKQKTCVAAPAVLNLADFASLEDVNEFDINIPLSVLDGAFKCSPSLSITLTLMELKITQDELPEVASRQTMFAPLSPCFCVSLPRDNDDDNSNLKSSLRKVKSLTDYVSSGNTKKVHNGEGTSDSKISAGSDESESNYPFDTDSFDDSDEGDSAENKEDIDVQNSCSYGTLMHANLVGGALDSRTNCDDENFVYNRSNKSNLKSSTDFGTEEKAISQSSKFGVLAWRKVRLSFRSPKVRGEPLLKKDYGEEGGDDIDYIRRQLPSIYDELAISEFGDDSFAVGSWQHKEVLNRDGSMKLDAQVFFASIDQRNEKAAGESACTSLVAVIADWLHSNPGIMPTKSEFDSLITEGSLHWRNLCENDMYKEKFPNKHFDLETILEAKTIPLSVIPERSFIGFFHPKELEEECFRFLDGSMSFDNIWEEISRVALERDPTAELLVYIVSWNDHFFLLGVDSNAYYIIDTLGERLYEGCDFAYVLKFDQNTTIEKTSNPNQVVIEASSSKEEDEASSSKEDKEGSSPNKEEKASLPKEEKEASLPKEEEEASLPKEEEKPSPSKEEEEEMVICRGKECCKEYIKSFLAAVPIRELEADMKKESRNPSLVHQRLQIEFSYTVQIVPPPAEYVTPEVAADLPVQMVALAVA